ncbi:MAG: ATP synthase F1 subunit gamma [Patescibacteria group bacterium]
MASSRQLKTKVKAVRNIRQITKAMQMVAATKMRRAQEAALRARPYAKKAFSLLLHLLQYAEAEGISGMYLGGNDQNHNKKEEQRPLALVVVTSDKGLAGSFNSAVLRLANRWKEEQESRGSQVEIVAVGKKGRDFFKARGGIIAAEFFKFSDIVTLSDITPLMKWILQAYEQGQYERIVFCSMHFISALVQKSAIHQILPLEKGELEGIIESIIPKTGRYAGVVENQQSTINNQQLSYILEPSAQMILDELVQDLIRVMIVHLIFESNASEHSARMVAMKNATENAENLMETLNLQLNKARQAAITQELAEVTTAKEALTSE